MTQQPTARPRHCRHCLGDCIGDCVIGDGRPRIKQAREQHRLIFRPGPLAQGLYRRRGFAEIGRRRGYYQPSGTDAVVMKREKP